MLLMAHDLSTSKYHIRLFKWIKVQIIFNFCLQRVDLKLVDFSYTEKETGISIFRSLMQEGHIAHKKLQAYEEQELINELINNQNNCLVNKIANLMTKTEEIFFYLISTAEEHIGEEEINRIIESPDQSGQTVFGGASNKSEKISGWILDRNIEVAFVDHKWMTPQFWFESNVEKMLKKGINPFVVDYEGKSQFDVRNFKKVDEKLLEPFITGNFKGERTEAFYSFHDSECNEKCGNLCKDKMFKFKLYTGKRKFKNEKRGGEGIVSFGTWHRKPAAFKSLELGKIQNPDSEKTIDSISNAEKTRAEFETVSKLSHPNILKVFHVFRYQETEKVGNYRSIDNWTIIVMEKHDKNIGELTIEERIYLPDLLQDVLGYV